MMPPETAPPEPERKIAETLEEAGDVTRQRARDLGALVVQYARKYLPTSQQVSESDDAPPPLTGTHAKTLRYLRLIPLLLLLAFGISFAWDFPDVQFTALGHTFVLEGLLRIMAVSGLIGFLTNWLAITMLFQPRQKRPILGQGLVPSQRERIIYRLAKAVSTELINEEIIKQKIAESGAIRQYRDMALQVARGVIEDPAFRNDFKQIISAYVAEALSSEEIRQRIAAVVMEKIEDYAGQGVGKLALNTYRFIKGEEDLEKRIDGAILDLPQTIDKALDNLDDFLDTIPPRIEARADDIEAWTTKTILAFVERLDIYGMLLANMRTFDESRLEMLIKTATNEQLNYIKYLGGVLGLIGGLVIWEPVLALATFGTLGLLIYGLDVWLLRRT